MQFDACVTYTLHKTITAKTKAENQSTWPILQKKYIFGKLSVCIFAWAKNKKTFRPPPKRKKKLQQQQSPAINVGSLGIFQNHGG